MRRESVRVAAAVSEEPDIQVSGLSVMKFRCWALRGSVWVELSREESLEALEKAKAQNGCKP